MTMVNKIPVNLAGILYFYGNTEYYYPEFMCEIGLFAN